MVAITAPTSGRAPRRLRPGASRYLQALRTPRGAAATLLIVLLTATALLAPVIFPQGYDEQSADAFQGFSARHLFGTDEVGRDILNRSVYGLRTDLILVFIAVPVTMVIGTLLGLLGFVAGWLGSGVQRVLDIIVGFPGLILGISIVLVLGTGATTILVAVIILGLPIFGRLARSALLSQQQREYVLAARTLGVSRWKIMIRHILPNAVDPIIVAGSVFVVQTIFFEASLSIVGLGIQPPEPSLGALLNTGMRYITHSPTYVIGPIVILLLLAFGFSLLTDALNETVNRK
ncbi:ABC transporter permease [Plantactinospora sp. KBS50]|uniref:ABC transporter permease n=1 Tax=Plantactinospora sp. KBS50 TaxID=2024580 RepID=UPI000BAAC80F|nr:ABC transporter permease [Plantactinospora sp. KBS50]ASW55740.1 peptide ABC transporter permease [Plantactinospora sp. KBS50]